MMRAWRALSLALLLLPAAGTAQEIRRWVDATGRVHFGDGAAAPDRSDTVQLTRGNIIGSGRAVERPETDAAASPSTWSHAVRSERIAPPAGQSSASPAAAPAAPAARDSVTAAAPAAVPALADAGRPECMPVEYKKISPVTGQIVRMRRLPCQPGVAPVEIGPY